MAMSCVLLKKELERLDELRDLQGETMKSAARCPACRWVDRAADSRLKALDALNRYFERYQREQIDDPATEESREWQHVLNYFGGTQLLSQSD